MIHRAEVQRNLELVWFQLGSGPDSEKMSDLPPLSGLSFLLKSSEISTGLSCSTR